MEVTVEHPGAVQFQIKTRGHFIVSDQPADSGGFDKGMTPPELLLVSLGSGAGFYAAQYLRKNKLATQGTRVRVTDEKVKDPVARMTNFLIEVDAPVEFTKEQSQGLDQAVANCLVHKTLTHAPKISLKVAGRSSLAKTEPYASASILPRSSFRIFAATIAVSPERSRIGLNSTTSAPTIGEGSA
jgi:putative redox protein